ncbi:hypothetical protein PGB90_002326 [Kerria lacca]
MVRLTPDLIQQSMQYLNPCRDRELCLRSYRIPMIENLGATLDQFDAIDLSDNDIRKLDGFPFLKRLNTLLLNHNPIVRIGDNLEECIPNLQVLVLTGCQIQELTDLNPLSTLSNLKNLSLLQNPVTHAKYYRQYVIFKISSLKILDFRKIKLKEREEAEILLKSKEGKEYLKILAKKSKSLLNLMAILIVILLILRFLLNENIQISQKMEELKKIREAIARASSLDDVERLNNLLQTNHDNNLNSDQNGMDVDEEDEENE